MATNKRTKAKQEVIDGLVETMGHSASIRPYTVVEVYSFIDGMVYRGVGMARQGNHDTWNEQMGREIAFGRAVDMIIKHRRNAPRGNFVVMNYDPKTSFSNNGIGKKHEVEYQYG